jgi:hypothetical protein
MKSIPLFVASLALLLAGCSRGSFPDKPPKSMQIVLLEDEREHYLKTPMTLQVEDPNAVQCVFAGGTQEREKARLGCESDGLPGE